MYMSVFAVCDSSVLVGMFKRLWFRYMLLDSGI